MFRLGTQMSPHSVGRLLLHTQKLEPMCRIWRQPASEKQSSVTNLGMLFNRKRSSDPSLFGASSRPLPPLSNLLGEYPHGSVFPAKPCPEERETGTNEAIVGCTQESHFDAMGFLLFWVSHVFGCVNSSSSISLCFFNLDPLSWLAWTCDAIDFFSVSLTIVSLQKQFNRSTHDIVSRTSSNAFYRIPMSFFPLLDNVHHPHTVIPPCRCSGSLPLFCHLPACLTSPLYRSSLVSSLIDLVESGRWSRISLSSVSSLSGPASFKPFTSSSPSEVSLVSAWEASGV